MFALACIAFCSALSLLINSGSTFKIRTIVTDAKFVERAQKLEEALKSDNCKTYCEEKGNTCQNQQEREEWSLLRVLFEPVSAHLYVYPLLLGFLT